MNFNAIHNILNLVGIVVGALLLYDWTLLFDPATAATVASALLFGDKVIKIGMNLFRDGLGGLFKPQPPVQS